MNGKLYGESASFNRALITLWSKLQQNCAVISSNTYVTSIN